MKIDVTEALRYLGVKEPEKDMLARAKKTARGLEDRIKPRYVFRDFSLEKREGGVYLRETDVTLPGKLAESMLAECDKAALLICTLGTEFDRLLRQAQARDMAEAVILDACGSAYVESACGEAEKEIAARHPEFYLTDRFSPGYGDLPLSLQPEILAALNGEKLLGVYATASHLLNPMKSVTAVVGLADKPQAAKIRGCGVCALKGNCAYRERGITCVSAS